MIRLNLVLILEILWEVRELIFEGFYAELPFQDELKFYFHIPRDSFDCLFNF